MASEDTGAPPRPTQEDSLPELRLGGRYRLLTGSRLPELDLGGAVAVAVRDDHYPDDALFARICPADAQPRLEIMGNLRHMLDANVMRPLDWGAVPWPGAPRKRMAVVFHRPEHGAVLPAGTGKAAPMPSETLARQVIAPATLTLGHFAQRGLTHRSIRPDNVYWAGGGRNAVLLGDCVTHAPALLQPALFEPVDSAMTPPIGRGDGLIVDDFYALGVTLLMLATGQCALLGTKDTEIIEAKLARGSYAALMGNGRPPFGLRELLRGLLADDPTERWGFEELEQWLAGGMRATVQDATRRGAGRSFAFDGREYGDTRALAHAFGRNPKAAARAAADPELEKWLRRNVADAGIANGVCDALRSGSGRVADARQLARICAVLDHAGPIRYKGLIAMAPGLGHVLADAFLRKDQERIGVIGEAIAGGVALDWYQNQSVYRQLRYEEKVVEIKLMQNLLRHGGLGYGIERCLYMLNPAFPCLSDVLDGRYVVGARELLPALEEIVREKGSLSKLVDRHLAAFVASRIKTNIDRRLAAIEAAKGDGTATKLGMLGILALMQNKHGPPQLPCLTDWLARELEPSIARLHARSLREQVRKRLAAVAGGGSLVDLNACLNNEKLLRADEAGRKQAMRTFVGASREIAQLESKEFHDSTQELGWKIASGISASAAAASVVFVMLV